jgi:hypothetical protein
VLPLPTYAGLSPAVGPSDGGTVVTLVGTGFTAAADIACNFGNVAAVGVFSSPTAVTCTAPTQVAGSVPVTLTFDGVAAATAGGAPSFTYTASPTVQSVYPSVGVVDGGAAVIVGRVAHRQKPGGLLGKVARHVAQATGSRASTRTGRRGRQDFRHQIAGAHGGLQACQTP